MISLRPVYFQEFIAPSIVSEPESPCHFGKTPGVRLTSFSASSTADSSHIANGVAKQTFSACSLIALTMRGWQVPVFNLAAAAGEVYVAVAVRVI